METKQKRILIALDYDPSAQKIAEEGYTLAKSINATTILLHVVLEYANYSSLSHTTIMGFVGIEDIGKMQKEIHAGPEIIATAFLEKSKKHLGNKDIQVLVKEGEFAQSILEVANEQNVDLIVMGSHSKRWLEKIVMGSVTEKVLSKTTIPLFIIPIRNKTD